MLAPGLFRTNGALLQAPFVTSSRRLSRHMPRAAGSAEHRKRIASLRRVRPDLLSVPLVSLLLFPQLHVGADWEVRANYPWPYPTGGMAQSYDPTPSAALLFGGGGGIGTNWTPFLPVAAPVGRSERAMAFDAIRGRTVLFGGSSSS